MARKPGSPVRKRLIELINVVGPCHGYKLYKYYIEFYPKVTMRNIFYHLKKGTDLGEFVIYSQEHVTGEYSWGSHAEKIEYTLGPEAKPRGDKRLETLKK